MKQFSYHNKGVLRVIRSTFFILMFFLISCVTTQQKHTGFIESIPLDTVFSEFYNELGGEIVLGKVISYPNKIEETRTQYLENALLIYDPNTPSDRKVKLWSIGHEMNFEEPSIYTPDNVATSASLINGHVVPEEFMNVYTELGGEDVVGKPLTGMIYSPAYRRYEQYFENLGFYRLDIAPIGNVNLLAYGSWACKGRCQDTQDEESIVDIRVPIEGIFMNKVNECGIDFSGYLLEDFTRQTETNIIKEAVFKNLVMGASLDNNYQVEILPLPELVGIRRGQLKTPSNNPDMIFVPVRSESEGIDVHKEIFEFIQNRAGNCITGLPYTQFQPYGKIFRQCFINICFLYDPAAMGRQKIFPEPLGYTYLRIHHLENPDISIVGDDTIYSESLQDYDRETIIETRERHPSISTKESQSIYIKAYDQSDTGFSNLEMTLSISIPGGGETVFALPKTDINGETRIEIPAIIAPRGTLIPYRVCVVEDNKQVCKTDSYVIWADP